MIWGLFFLFPPVIITSTSVDFRRLINAMQFGLRRVPPKASHQCNVFFNQIRFRLVDACATLFTSKLGKKTCKIYEKFDIYLSIFLSFFLSPWRFSNLVIISSGYASR